MNIVVLMTALAIGGFALIVIALMICETVKEIFKNKK